MSTNVGGEEIKTGCFQTVYLYVSELLCWNIIKMPLKKTTRPLNSAAVAVAQSDLQKSRDVRLADAPPTTQTQH